MDFNVNGKLNRDRPKLRLKPMSLAHVKATERCIKKRLRDLLRKTPDALNAKELSFLNEHSHLVNQIQTMIKKTISKRETLMHRMEEHKEDSEVVNSKLDMLADWIRSSRPNVVVYTGAGISTSASIPDYRGPAGKWTMLRKQENSLTINGVSKRYNRRNPRLSLPEASNARPTEAHMVLAKLVEENYVSHVVSQNVDGLHLRSGIPTDRLSELHGNLFIELCPTCQRAVYRNVDTAERTSYRRHRTGRLCRCGQGLVDSIVHFGEKSRPFGESTVYRWHSAVKAVQNASVIVCFGTSLSVLRHYPALWPRGLGGINPKQRLAIINLQWTPKDKISNLKIYEDCNTVLKGLAHRLDIVQKPYNPQNDPLQYMATPLKESEKQLVNRPVLHF